MNPLRLAAVVVLALSINVPAAHGQLLLSINDNKVELVNGAATVVKSPRPDTLTVIDTKSWPPKVVAELDVPGSVVGPPFSVAVAPDESIALVTANEKLDPSDATNGSPTTPCRWSISRRRRRGSSRRSRPAARPPACRSIARAP
jgi:hypothetical protein